MSPPSRSLKQAPPTTIVEVGCGAGNTVFPLLEMNKNPGLEIHACDYSSEAVEVVKVSSQIFVKDRGNSDTNLLSSPHFSRTTHFAQIRLQESAMLQSGTSQVRVRIQHPQSQRLWRLTQQTS